jgi:L-threonylcarbamoyladenylate synthase
MENLPETGAATDAEIRHAGQVIRDGGLVAFPTETVYGLGANALDADAVDRIYRAKGRPANAPLIVHVATVEQARGLAAEWPAQADVLAAAFWPGPLTLVVRKLAAIPDRVTAGLPTVGLRIPAHPVAKALLEAAGVPIAAPSANRFMGVSPTDAAHVRSSLGEAADLVLEGGASEVGLESTVLSLVAEPPLLLRLGMIRRDQIEAVIGPVLMGAAEGRAAEEPHAAPGMHARHYSPRTPLVVVGEGEDLPPGRRFTLWWQQAPVGGEALQLPADPDGYARELYRALHAADAAGADFIVVEAPPTGLEWEAIWDRLHRAAAH